jgi:ATP-dependent DNA ligase
VLILYDSIKRRLASCPLRRSNHRYRARDLRPEPLETRKATLASLLGGSLPGLRLVEHLAHDGESVFRHACKLGCEGIVSKRLGSRYRSGRSPDWLKFKNPEAPAVKREAEEDWGKREMAALRPSAGQRSASIQR